MNLRPNVQAHVHAAACPRRPAPLPGCGHLVAGLGPPAEPAGAHSRASGDRPNLAPACCRSATRARIRRSPFEANLGARAGNVRHGVLMSSGWYLAPYTPKFAPRQARSGSPATCRRVGTADRLLAGARGSPGPMRRRSTSQRRLPGSHRPPARRMMSANSCGQRTATMAPSMLNSHGPTRAGRGGGGEGIGSSVGTGAAPGQRVTVLTPLAGAQQSDTAQRRRWQRLPASDGAGKLLRLRGAGDAGE